MYSVDFEYHGSTYKDYGAAYDYYGSSYEQRDDYGMYGPAAAYSESASRGRGGGRGAPAGMHRGTLLDPAVCQFVYDGLMNRVHNATHSVPSGHLKSQLYLLTLCTCIVSSRIICMCVPSP